MTRLLWFVHREKFTVAKSPLEELSGLANVTRIGPCEDEYFPYSIRNMNKSTNPSTRFI
jgi:hypothetical protein